MSRDHFAFTAEEEDDVKMDKPSHQDHGCQAGSYEPECFTSSANIYVVPTVCQLPLS